MKHPKNFLQLLTLIFLLQVNHLKANDSTVLKEQFFTFKIQFFQIKEGFNYGLVLNGLNFVGAYKFQKTYQQGILSYEADLGYGVAYRQGVGMTWHLKPVDIFYGFKLNKQSSTPVSLGAYFAANYQWQIYPELQSGHMYWYSSFEFGPRVSIEIPLGAKYLHISWTNSLAGWCSRPLPGTETHFYSKTISDFVSNPHSNLQFGSFNLFNHTDIEIEFIRDKRKRRSIAYEFEYFGYYEAPRLNYMSHSLNLKWKIGKL